MRRRPSRPRPPPRGRRGLHARRFRPLRAAQRARHDQPDPGLRNPSAATRAAGWARRASNVIINGERLAQQVRRRSRPAFAASMPPGRADRDRRRRLARHSRAFGPGRQRHHQPAAISGRFEYRAIARPRYARPQLRRRRSFGQRLGGDVEWTVAAQLTASAAAARAAGRGSLDLRRQRATCVEHARFADPVQGRVPRRFGARRSGPRAGGTIVNAQRQLRPLMDPLRQRRRSRLCRRCRYGSAISPTSTTATITRSAATSISRSGPGRLKLIGLERFDTGRRPGDVAARSMPTAGRPPASRFDQVRDSGEQIGRAEYRWNMLGGGWQLDAEAAFNRYDAVSALRDARCGRANSSTSRSPARPGGVTEDRYEAILTHNRSLAATLTLQVGAGGEYSKLRQTGPGGLTRGLLAAQGLADPGVDAPGRPRLSLKLARTVGQLSFGDFLAGVDLRAEQLHRRQCRAGPAAGVGGRSSKPRRTSAPGVRSTLRRLSPG